MGVLVNVIEEIYNRLNTAIGSGKDLYGVNVVRIGDRTEARTNSNFPIININFRSAVGEPVYKRNGNVDIMTIEISLLINKKAGINNNKLYKVSDTSGAIYVLEKLLNVLDKDTSGNVDLSFNSTVTNLRTYDYTIDQTNDMVEIDVTLTVQTVFYQLGSR